MWVAETTVIAAGGNEKEDDSEDEDAEGCHSEGKYTYKVFKRGCNLFLAQDVQRDTAER